MQIEKIGKKTSIYIQNASNSSQRLQVGSQLRKLQPNMGVLSWINQEINIQIQNQRTLQQKIIQLYEQIQKKAIKNIEKKNKNQILEAQIQTYISIINKIQKRRKLNQQQNKQQNIYNYTFHQQNQAADPHRISQRNILQRDLKNSSKIHATIHQSVYYQGQYTKRQNNQGFSNDQKNRQEHYPRQTQINHIRQTDYPNLKRGQIKPTKTQAAQYTTPSTNLNSVLLNNFYRKTSNNSASNLRNYRENKIISNTTPKSLQTNSQISICPISGYQTPTNIKTHRQSSSNYRSPTITYRTNNQQYQRQNIYVSPRPSIDVGMPKLSTPNKSFLKKNNMSTGNLVNKYASIDIQDLWRQSNPLLSNRAQKNTIQKGNAKEYINSLRENSSINFKFESKLS